VLLDEGRGLMRMSRAAGWPARQIRLLNRNGCLLTVDGRPYKLPMHGETPAAHVWILPEFALVMVTCRS
jgi:hypothetical protein